MWAGGGQAGSEQIKIERLRVLVLSNLRPLAAKSWRLVKLADGGEEEGEEQENDPLIGLSIRDGKNGENTPALYRNYNIILALAESGALQPKTFRSRHSLSEL